LSPRERLLDYSLRYGLRVRHGPAADADEGCGLLVAATSSRAGLGSDFQSSIRARASSSSVGRRLEPERSALRDCQVPTQEVVQDHPLARPHAAEVGWNERRHDAANFAGGQSVATLARGIPKKGVTA
jgi:hypothetical protein